MKRRSATFPLVAGLLLACTCLAGMAVAQGSQDYPYPNPRGIFIAGARPDRTPANPGPNLAQWHGSFTDLTHVKRTFISVGTDPHKTNAATTVPLFIIPIKMVYDKNHGNRTFDPAKHKLPNGETVLQMIEKSPILNSNVDFKQGGTELGKTQYIDAFQRGNFWSVVKKNNKWHVLLGKATVLPEQTFNCNQSSCSVGNEFGKVVGLFDFNSMDALLQTYMKKFKQIKPNTLPLFLTYDVYLTSGGCCIGGYHFLNGAPPTGQTYAFTTTIDQGSRVFSQDTAAMSHEIGEWAVNPFFGSDTVGCNDNSQMEVGDPLVLDDHPYTVGNFTYHLQDLVFIGYFGAPPKTSLLKWLSFQNDEKHVCPGQ
jgi:hypothetical protein